MSEEYLKGKVDDIIKMSGDDEMAHSEEDALHLAVIQAFAPKWVSDEIKRLSEANFARWCA